MIIVGLFKKKSNFFHTNLKMLSPSKDSPPICNTPFWSFCWCWNTRGTRFLIWHVSVSMLYFEIKYMFFQSHLCPFRVVFKFRTWKRLIQAMSVVVKRVGKDYHFFSDQKISNFCWVSSSVHCLSNSLKIVHKYSLSIV